jgi:ankyrin repeat protein
MVNEAMLDELYNAVEGNDLVRCKELIALGYDVEGHAGKMPLVSASSRGHVDLCKILIEAGADINVLNGYPLLSAAIAGRAEMCKFLIDSGADLQHKKGDGWTPLHGAATAGKLEACRVLIEGGMDVNAVTLNGRTALSEAIRRGNSDVAKYLIEVGADWTLSVPDDRYQRLTLFQLAVRHGHEDIANYFVSACGEDCAQRTVEGVTMMALAGKHAAVKQVLRSAKTAAALGRSLAPDLGGETRRARSLGQHGLL